MGSCCSMDTLSDNFPSSSSSSKMVKITFRIWWDVDSFSSKFFHKSHVRMFNAEKTVPTNEFGQQNIVFECILLNVVRDIVIEGFTDKNF